MALGLIFALVVEFFSKQVWEKYGEMKGQMLSHSQDRIFFFHIPKCAGTSVYRSLGDGLPKRTPIDKLLYRHRLTIIHDYWHRNQRRQKLRRAQRSQLISGHFQWSTYQEMKPAPTDFLFTFLRQPRDRLLSLYRFVCSSQGSKWVDDKDIEGIGIQDFLQLDLASLNWQADNVMVRTFSGTYSQNFNSAAEWNEALEIAKLNLSKMDFIGLNDHFEEGIFKLSTKLNLPCNREMTWENKSLISKEDFTVPKEAENELEMKCRYDNLLYEFALENLILS